MVSDLLCQCHGRHMNPINIVQDARNIIRYGKNHDGYWDGEDVAEAAKRAVEISRLLHPGCISLFCFDNSSNHNKVADDARNVRKLNLSDGGKNTPIMKDGYFTDANGMVQVHKMTNEKGEQKGLKAILEERGLWLNRYKKKDAVEVLLDQPDFAKKQLRSKLVETIRGHGDDCWVDMYVKYHPEMNFIEMYWGYVKRNVRKRCTYDFMSLTDTVPACLDEVGVDFIRRAARKSFRYIDAYYKGLSAKQVEFAVKKYSRHRTLPANYLDDITF